MFKSQTSGKYIKMSKINLIKAFLIKRLFIKSDTKEAGETDGRKAMESDIFLAFLGALQRII